MARNKFPTTRAKQVILARAMIHGLEVDIADFPSPPISSSSLGGRLQGALAITDERTTAEAALREIIDRETEAYDDLNDDLKTDIQYVEMIAKNDDAMLKQVGWSARAAPQALQPPNAPRSLEIVAQGRGSAHFDWKEPVGGGAVRMYRLLRMEVGDASGVWQEAASAIESEAVVSGQANGKEYIFCVVAINAAGVSERSNPVNAYL